MTSEIEIIASSAFIYFTREMEGGKEGREERGLIVFNIILGEDLRVHVVN